MLGGPKNPTAEQVRDFFINLSVDKIKERQIQAKVTSNQRPIHIFSTHKNELGEIGN